MSYFYTYLWCREDGTPYYVGKGKGGRGFTSAAHALRRPKDRARIVFRYWESEAEAFDAERKLIERYGRKDLGTGCLRNLTEGVKHPLLAQMNRDRKGLPLSPETKQLMSRQRRGVPHSASHRAALAAHLMKVKGKGSMGIHNAGGHKYWHVGRGLIHPSCLYCQETA
jgi:hypothetical protein